MHDSRHPLFILRFDMVFRIKIFDLSDHPAFQAIGFKQSDGAQPREAFAKPLKKGVFTHPERADNTHSRDHRSVWRQHDQKILARAIEAPPTKAARIVERGWCLMTSLKSAW